MTDFDGRWIMSGIHGLKEFPILTQDQKQKILDDLTDNKLRIITDIAIVDNKQNINRRWAFESFSNARQI